MKKILCLLLSICMIAIPHASSANVQMSQLLIEENFESYQAATAETAATVTRPALVDGTGLSLGTYAKNPKINIVEENTNKYAYIDGKSAWSSKLVLPSLYTGRFTVSAKVKIFIDETTSSRTALQMVVGTDSSSLSAETSLGGIGLTYQKAEGKIYVKSSTLSGLYGDEIETSSKLDFAENTTGTNWVTIKLEFTGDGKYDTYIGDEKLLENQTCYNDETAAAASDSTKIAAIYFASRATDGTCRVMIDDLSVTANYTVTGAEEIQATISQNQLYDLPDKVKLITDTGYIMSPVTWKDSITQFSSGESGTYDIEGTVDGYSEKVYAKITVKSDLREYLVPTETFDSFSDLVDQQIILVRNPVQLKDPRVYIVNQNDNYLLSYNNTREYMTIADIDDNKTVSGKVISEFDVDFNEDCSDFYIIHNDSAGRTVLSTSIVNSSGKKILRFNYESSTTQTLIGTEKNLSLKNKKAHFKFVIDTKSKSADLYIEFDNGDRYAFEGYPLYLRNSGYNSDIEIKNMRIAFNRSLSEAPDKAYFLDNIAIYKSYSIESVSDIAQKVDIGEKYVFPETVDATTADGDSVSRPVVWENEIKEITFESEGTHTYEGTVSGYDEGNITLTLTAVLRSIVSIDNITDEVVKYGDYVFPEKAEALLSDGEKKNVSITWEGTDCFTTDTLGDFHFTGTVEGYSNTVTLTVTVKPIVIESIQKTKMAFYETEEIKLPNKVFAILNNGEIIEENVVWEDFTSVVNGHGTYTIYGEVEDNVLPAVCELHVIAALPKYIDENFEKYKDGYALAFAPWRTANPKVLIKSGEDGKYATYENLHDFFALYPDPYTGIAAIETSFCIEDGFEDFRYELTEKANSSCVVSVMFSNDKSITLQDEHGTSYVYKNAFPIGEYFEIMLIANTYNQTYEVYIDNKRISDVVPFKTNVEDVQLWWVRWADRSDAKIPVTAHFKDVYITLLDSGLRNAAELITVPATVKSSISLPETVSGYTVTWTTSNSAYISTGGTVNCPSTSEGSKDVVLTATLKGDCGYGTMEYKKEFPVKVLANELTDSEIVNSTYDWLTFDKISNEPTSAVSADMTFMTQSEYGAEISWKTTDTSVVDSEGRIIVPTQDKTLTITATISSGNVSRDKLFENITVKTGDRTSDLQAVRRAKLALSIVSSTTGNLSLPGAAAEAVSISWKSGNFAVISNSGIVTPPSTATVVVMTATLTKGSYTEEKTFEVTVNPSSGTSGGPNGGGSSSGGSSGGGAIGGVSAPVTPQLTTPVKATPFTDVTSASWEKDAVNHLYQKGIISGNGDGQFYPERNITREEFIKMVLIALDFEITDKVTHSIPDAPLGSWYDYYLQTAYNMGIVGGYPDGRFGVGDNILRQDMAVILCNAMEKAGKLSDKDTLESNFSDEGEIASYAKEKIALLVNKGYISGMGDGRFSPLTSSTRAQAAQLIYNVIK